VRRGCLTALLITIPVVFLLVAGAWTYGNLSRLDAGVRTTGQVVDLLREDSSDGPAFRPVVEFVDQRGTRHRLVRSFSVSGSVVPSVGDEVDIVYDPADPTDAAVVGVLFWFGPAIFAAVGIVGLVVALIIRVVVVRTTGVGGDSTPAPVGLGQRGSVEFRRVETDITADGQLRYRVIAVDDQGGEFHSKWYDEDPTVDIVTKRPALRVDGSGEVTW
jgi:hypothetical protein